MKKNVVSGSKSFGIQLVATEGVQVSANEITGPQNSPFSVTGISVNNSLSVGNLLQDNILRGAGAGTTGILINGSSQQTEIDGNDVRGFNQQGVQVFDNADETDVTENKVINNAGDGIQVDDTTGTDVLTNVARDNGLDGIELGDAGIAVGDNRAFDNGGWGIIATEIVNDLGGNTAGGNDAGQCSGVSC